MLFVNGFWLRFGSRAVGQERAGLVWLCRYRLLTKAPGAVYVGKGFISPLFAT